MPRFGSFGINSLTIVKGADFAVAGGFCREKSAALRAFHHGLMVMTAMNYKSSTLLSLTLVLAAGLYFVASAAQAAGRAPELDKALIKGLDKTAQGLVAHRAVYNISLQSSRGGSDGVAAAHGAMLYRFADACDSWTVENNIYLKLTYPDGEDVDITWSYVSQESKDGREYRFRMRHVPGKDPLETLKGKAALTLAGDGSARFVDQDGKKSTVKLPQGTLFPTRHLARVIEAGRGGAPFVADTLFDGSSVDNPYRVTASIGRAQAAAGTHPLFKAAGIEDAAAWPVRLAFFPARSKEPTPEFELGVDYRADGLAAHITQDFGEFTLDMTPGEIEILPKPEC